MWPLFQATKLLFIAYVRSGTERQELKMFSYFVLSLYTVALLRCHIVAKYKTLLRAQLCKTLQYNGGILYNQ